MGQSIRDAPLSSDWHNHTINRALDNAHVRTQIKSISGLKTTDNVIQPSDSSFNLCLGYMQNRPVVNVHMPGNKGSLSGHDVLMNEKHIQAYSNHKKYLDTWKIF